MRDTPPPTPETTTRPAPQVAFDWRDFLPYLADADLTEAEKREFIETMWSIVLAFVDLGFEVRSPEDCCGQAIDLKAAIESIMVDSEISTNRHEKGDAA